MSEQVRDGYADDPVEDMLSWRFRAGMAAAILFIVALTAFGSEISNPTTLLVVVGPLVLTSLYTRRYIQARRKLIVAGLWPE